MSVKEIKAGIAFKKDNTYLFVKERNGKWGVPKGHMETVDKEDPKRTAIREVREETNIIVEYEALHSKTMVYDNNLYLVDVDTNSRFLTIPDDLKDNDEIIDYGWFTKEVAHTKNLNAWAKHLVNRVPYF